MIIAQISDTHILAKSSGDALGVARAENLRRCIADINRQGADIVVHTGDSVHHGAAAEYAHFREILGDLEPPLFLVPGNRDRQSELRAALGDRVFLPSEGEHVHYVVEDYPLRLIALDSVAAGERKGVFCAQRRAWLERMLAREPDRPTILFMHHPPFDIAPHYVDGYRNAQEAADLAMLVGRYPQVVRLLCGHVHRWHRQSWGGTLATTMPSVAVDLRKGVDARFGEAPIYFLHAVAKDGSLASQARIVPG